VVALSLHIVVAIVIGTYLALIENEVTGRRSLFVQCLNLLFPAFRTAFWTALPLTVGVPRDLNMCRINLDTFASEKCCERLSRL
jgi:hypothetical protein